jgi:hypothetical protein
LAIAIHASLLALPACNSTASAARPDDPPPVPACRERVYAAGADSAFTCDPGQRAELLTASVIVCRCDADAGVGGGAR